MDNLIGVWRRNQGKISTSHTAVFAPPDFISAGPHSNFPSANTAGGFLPVLPRLMPPVDFAHRQPILDHTGVLSEVVQADVAGLASIAAGIPVMLAPRCWVGCDSTGGVCVCGKDSVPQERGKWLSWPGGDLGENKVPHRGRKADLEKPCSTPWAPCSSSFYLCPRANENVFPGL